jgi:hypothetical protein
MRGMDDRRNQLRWAETLTRFQDVTRVRLDSVGDRKSSRRAFLRTAVAAAGAAVVGPTVLGALEPLRVATESRRGARVSHVRLGVASYSLRNFPLEKAIESVKSL